MNGLESVQTGDTVIYWPANQDALPGYVVVEHATKTQITVAGKRWLRRDGCEVGDASGNIWVSKARIVPLTDATRLAAEKAILERTVGIRRQRAEWVIHETRWGRVPLETLEQIAEMLKAAREPEE
jgi:hypothetical protein